MVSEGRYSSTAPSHSKLRCINRGRRPSNVASRVSSRQAQVGSAPACLLYRPSFLTRWRQDRPGQGISAIAQAVPVLERKQIHQDVHNTPEAADEQGSFSWTKQWYPVAIVEDLEVSKPTSVKLFGKSLVLWRDAAEVWQCFADTCPHRLVPLSEGRIAEDGTLQCSYHGWCFDSEGACTSVPQAENPEQEHTAAAHTRACATVYPTQVLHRLLWVWPETGSNAYLEAMSKEATVMPDLLQEEHVAYAIPWFMRELPYGHDVLIENLLDPAHVPFAHHGVSGGGNRYQVPLSILGQPSLSEGGQGFSVLFRQDISGETNGSTQLQTMSKSQDAHIVFKAPNLVNYKYGGELGVQIVSYSTPTTPGNCRVLFAVVMDRRTAPKRTMQVLDLKPSWLKFLDHYERNLVLDGDNCFLHMQDSKLHGEEANSQYYMPTSMDRALGAFRRWMRESAGPVPWAVPTGPDTWREISSRRQLLDRYNQHTKHCKHCSKALDVFTVAQRMAAGGLAVAALSGANAVGGGQAAPSTWAAIAAATFLSAVTVWQLEAQRRKLLFIDYVHSER